MRPQQGIAILTRRGRLGHASATGANPSLALGASVRPGPPIRRTRSAPAAALLPPPRLHLSSRVNGRSQSPSPRARPPPLHLWRIDRGLSVTRTGDMTRSRIRCTVPAWRKQRYSLSSAVRTVVTSSLAGLLPLVRMSTATRDRLGLVPGSQRSARQTRKPAASRSPSHRRMWIGSTSSRPTNHARTNARSRRAQDRNRARHR